MPRPRVGIVANTIDAEFGLLTGGNLHFMEVAKRMRDFDVVIFAPSFVAAEIRPLVPNATVVVLPSARRFTARKIPLFAASLVTWIAEWRALRACDVVYASSHFLGDTIPATFARGRSTLVVIHHVIATPFGRSGSLVQNAIAFATERLSLALIRNRAGVLAFDNDLLRSELDRDGFRNSKVVSGNAVDVPAANGEVARAHDAAYVGRLSPMKGVDDLLRAWAIVTRAVPDARLRVIGDGLPSYEAELRALARTLGIADSVAFLGRASDAVKFETLRASGLFLFASKEEGWGIALAEAMCVTYDLPPYREVFPRGRSSVSVGDVDGFARAAIGLLENESARRQLAVEAAELARTFTWDRVAAIESEAILMMLRGGPRVRNQS
jgi:glycosyltransferase involved in cell wall biosynthesis